MVEITSNDGVSVVREIGFLWEVGEVGATGGVSCWRPATGVTIDCDEVNKSVATRQL